MENTEIRKRYADIPVHIDFNKLEVLRILETFINVPNAR